MSRLVEANAWSVDERRFDGVAKAGDRAAEDVESRTQVADSAGSERADDARARCVRERKEGSRRVARHVSG